MHLVHLFIFYKKSIMYWNFENKSVAGKWLLRLLWEVFR